MERLGDQDKRPVGVVAMAVYDLTTDEIRIIAKYRKAKKREQLFNAEKSAEAAFRKLYPSEEYILAVVPDAVRAAFKKYGMHIVSANPEDISSATDCCIVFDIAGCNNHDSVFDYGGVFASGIGFSLVSDDGQEEWRVENVSDWISNLRAKLNYWSYDNYPSDSCKEYGDMSLDQAQLEYTQKMSVYESEIKLAENVIAQLEESLAQDGE